MKNTLKIAKAELLNLFYSPVAWLVILFYLYSLWGGLYGTNVHLLPRAESIDGGGSPLDRL